MEAMPVYETQTHPPQSFFVWQVAETLYEPRRKPLDSPQTIGEHAYIPYSSWACYIGGKVYADTNSSVKYLLMKNSIRCAFEAAYLQWMEGEKELPVLNVHYLPF